MIKSAFGYVRVSWVLIYTDMYRTATFLKILTNNVYLPKNHAHHSKTSVKFFVHVLLLSSIQLH